MSESFGQKTKSKLLRKLSKFIEGKQSGWQTVSDRLAVEESKNYRKMIWREYLGRRREVWSTWIPEEWRECKVSKGSEGKLNDKAKGRAREGTEK